MAITFNQLAAISGSTSNTNSYAGNAGAPVTNDLLICGVIATATVAAATMTGVWTWNLLTSFTTNGGADTLYVFWANATGTTSTTPTFDCTGDNATSCGIHCVRVAGAEGQTQPYIRQMKTATGSGAANPSITLDRALLTGNGVLAFATNLTNSAAQWTPPATPNWSEGGEVGLGTQPAGSFESAWIASGDTRTTLTWNNANTTAWGLIVMELWVAGGTSGENAAIYGSSGSGFFGLGDTP